MYVSTSCRAWGSGLTNSLFKACTFSPKPSTFITITSMVPHLPGGCIVFCLLPNRLGHCSLWSPSSSPFTASLFLVWVICSNRIGTYSASLHKPMWVVLQQHWRVRKVLDVRIWRWQVFLLVHWAMPQAHIGVF